MRCRERALLVAAVAMTAAGLVGSPASAGTDCDEDAVVDRGGGEAGAECETPTDPTPDPVDGGSEQECDPDSEEIAYYDEPPEERADQYLDFMKRNEPPEGMTYQGAFNCAGRYLSGPHLVPDPEEAAAEPLRQEARARVLPDAPSPRVSPEQAVVGFATWLWVEEADWQTTTATETDGAVTVRVEARPRRVVWDLVEGVRECEGPGIPWTQQAQEAYEAQPAELRGVGNPACTFEFVHSSTTQPDDVYRASVTVFWEFSWWLNGEPRGVFGTWEATSDFDLRVGEIQTLRTG